MGVVRAHLAKMDSFQKHYNSHSMEIEGWDAAKALAKEGVGAFVLEYRLYRSPPDVAGSRFTVWRSRSLSAVLQG